jgi:hypothetical protein
MATLDKDKQLKGCEPIHNIGRERFIFLIFLYFILDNGQIFLSIASGFLHRNLQYLFTTNNKLMQPHKLVWFTCLFWYFFNSIFLFLFFPFFLPSFLFLLPMILLWNPSTSTTFETIISTTSNDHALYDALICTCLQMV